MVQHILKIFYKEFTSVNQAALLLGLFTFISQILGLVRDRIFASQIGVGLELDIYYTAFRIPDIVFAVAASLVAATILMPFFVSAQSKDTYGHDVSQKFLTNIFSAFSLGMIAISLLVFLLMPVLAQWVAPGFDETATRELIKLSRLMLLSPFLLGVSNLIGTITQASRKFFIHASAPILYNFGIILGAFFSVSCTRYYRARVWSYFRSALSYYYSNTRPVTARISISLYMQY
jgi:putative peptidoglycan lipid II flippase